MWVPGVESIVCSSLHTPIPQQPNGSCDKIGEKKKYISNPTFANSGRADHKKCTDAGIDTLQIIIEFSCQPDLYLNKAGQ